MCIFVHFSESEWSEEWVDRDVVILDMLVGKKEMDVNMSSEFKNTSEKCFKREILTGRRHVLVT